MAKQKKERYLGLWNQDSEKSLKIYKEILTKIANKVDADPEKFVERFNQTRSHNDQQDFIQSTTFFWGPRTHLPSKFIDNNTDLDESFEINTFLTKIRGYRFRVINEYLTDDVLEWFLSNDFEKEDFLEWGKGEYFSRHAVNALLSGAVPIKYINELTIKEYWIGMTNPMSLFAIYGKYDDMKTKETKKTGAMTLTWYGKRDNRKVVWIRAVFKGPLDGSADEYTLDSLTKNPVD